MACATKLCDNERRAAHDVWEARDGDGVDSEACHTTLQVASTELYASNVCGLLARAILTAVRVHSRQL